MVWGCVTPQGVGQLYLIDGNMDSKKYISILEDAYLGTLKNLHANRKDFILQADNDPKHTSKITRAWLRENHIPTLDWPANSPDMNIMENLWAYLEHHICSHPKRLSNSTELWMVLQEEWNKIPPEYIRNLYESLPRRVEAVCTAKGGNTNYQFDTLSVV